MHKNIQETNYIYIKNFISPERAHELAKSFVKFSKENNLSGDIQVEKSQSEYNYIDFLELLCEKTPEVSKFLGETVLPTYSYARVYKKGSVLTRHRDRAACEVSLTLNLSKDKDWPIWIQTPDGKEVSLNLNSGDAVMYLGCQGEHWRDTFEGNEYVQVFLHYVRSRGANAWAAFDKVQTLPVEPKEETIDNQPVQDANIERFVPASNHLDALNEYICVFDNILPHDLCDAILAEYSNLDEWQLAPVGADSSVETSIRNVNQIAISFSPVIERNKNLRLELDQKLFAAAARAISLYNLKFPDASIQEDTGYELLKYETGQFYKQHTDHFKQQPRTISCSFALNDDYEGGEFAFFDNKFKHKLKKGSIIMFPSNFMFPHEILEVTKGTRYAIITWFV
jgi:Rps23 Pro-64 3,4-dihydroxylase Tpa1-like proline 4-hydroxylase